MGVPDNYRNANVSQHVAIIRVRDPGTQDYLHKCILSPFFQALVFGEQTGAGRGGLPKNKMDRLPIPLPPPAEQHRIVAKVDELMALCDRLEAAQAEREARRDRLVSASLARVTEPDSDDATSTASTARFHLDHFARLTTRPEHVKQLRQTILNLAVRGRLVPQDVNATPASEVLGINAPTDESLDLPERWVRMTLGQITSKMDSGWSPQCENIRRSSTDEWAVLRTTAVQPMRFDLCEHKVLPRKLSARPQYETHRGDILVTRAGPKNRVGVCCVVDRVEPRLMISDKLIRIHLHDGICPHFVALSLNTGESQIAIEGAKSGMAVMQMNISQDKLRGVPIPLPPLAEQLQIVAKVDELMALCDRLEASLASAATDRARLLEALLQEALAAAA